MDDTQPEIPLPKGRLFTRFVGDFVKFVDRNDVDPPTMHQDTNLRAYYKQLIGWADPKFRLRVTDPVDPAADAAARAAVYDRMWPGKSLRQQVKLTASQRTLWVRETIKSEIPEDALAWHYQLDRIGTLIKSLRCWPAGLFALPRPRQGRLFKCGFRMCPYCHFRRVVDFHKRFTALVDGPMWLHEAIGQPMLMARPEPRFAVRKLYKGAQRDEFAWRVKRMHRRVTGKLMTRLKRAGQRGWVRAELTSMLGSEDSCQSLRIVVLSDHPDCFRSGDFLAAKTRVASAATPAEAATVLIPDFLRYDHGLMIPIPPRPLDPLTPSEEERPQIEGAEYYSRFYDSSYNTQMVSEMWPGAGEVVGHTEDAVHVEAGTEHHLSLAAGE